MVSDGFARGVMRETNLGRGFQMRQFVRFAAGLAFAVAAAGFGTAPVQAREVVAFRDNVPAGTCSELGFDENRRPCDQIQAGSYVFMDVEYRGIGGQSGAVYDDFAPALCVLGTVVHRSGSKAIVDAGLKAFSTDRAFGPELLDITGIKYEFAGDEHGRLVLQNPSREILLGDKLRFIIPHCDPTVNLYDRIHCVKGELVEDAWSIMERASGRPYF